MKSKFPLLIILTGLILVGIGLWQFIDVKTQTHASLKQAKELIADQPDDAPKKREVNSKPPEMGETVGLLAIPKIKAELAIIEGTDPDDLEKGVGHYKGAYYPGDQRQIVLSGHRDTVFRKLGELEIGDSLKMEMPYGSYTYEIIDTKIVKSDDTSIITLQHNKEELILTTCYPFSYIGNAPKRYIIYAKPKNS
ncbi:class D sortase [Bacillus sp. ISL-40]|uniref:class D sortase n=1 Tax=unclassified Bacillus (in: firmicutes) TaxID=185979 RepID=UPI001BE5D407|nr:MULTISPECIES: class D sortase [unclassified Bacillus (in: firmicutes)]MBT2697866.1 class D sortase [Bacillus sp. ISL-40]MBT2721545.1 class D sortase [Bacillus sp. ISL-46]